MTRENPKVVKYSNDLSFSPDYSENPFSFCPFDKLRMTKRKKRPACRQAGCSGKRELP
ncbi:hypothetical protein [Flavobacterium sp.]|jgi:hypothetical protein|uniref:hypothetical protein n=1 Tax=Flavobacterium sp. TaxID=239 RepID=UPI0037BFAE18